MDLGWFLWSHIVPWLAGLPIEVCCNSGSLWGCVTRPLPIIGNSSDVCGFLKTFTVLPPHPVAQSPGSILANGSSFSLYRSNLHQLAQDPFKRLCGFCHCRLFFIVWWIFWFTFSLTCSAGHGMALFHNALPLIIKKCLCKARLLGVMLCYGHSDVFG